MSCRPEKFAPIYLIVVTRENSLSDAPYWREMLVSVRTFLYQLEIIVSTCHAVFGANLFDHHYRHKQSVGHVILGQNVGTLNFGLFPDEMLTSVQRSLLIISNFGRCRVTYGNGLFLVVCFHRRCSVFLQWYLFRIIPIKFIFIIK